MDPVTHFTSGIMGALAARQWFPKIKYFIPLCMFAAWIPDGDIFFGNGDPEFSLLYHRGITTSFFGGLFLALSVAGLMKLANKELNFLKATLLCYALVVTHIWLDLITTYGTQLLAPFTNHRYALDGAFIIDPVLTGIALLTMGLAFYFKEKRTFIASIGMAWFFAYPLINMGIGSYLESTYAAKLDEQGINYSEVRITPDALAPRYWKVVTTSGSEYIQDTIDLFGDSVTLPPQRYQRANNGELERLGKQESMFATYSWFSLWPHVAENKTNEGSTLVFGDLRFRSTNPVLVRIFKERKSPFTLTAYLDHEGNLTGWKFIKGASSIGETVER